MEITILNLLNKLKRYKQFIYHYKRTMKEEWTGYNIGPYVWYGRNLMGYVSIASRLYLPIYKERKGEGIYMLRPDDRKVIGQFLSLVIDDEIGSIKICAKDPETEEYIPLSRLIQSIQESIKENPNNGGKRIQIMDDKAPYTILKAVTTDGSTVVEYACPDMQIYEHPLRREQAYSFLDSVDKYFINTGLKERRKNVHRKNLSSSTKE